MNTGRLRWIKRISKDIEKSIKSLKKSPFSEEKRDLKKVENKSKELLNKLDINSFEMITPKVLTSGLIYYVGRILNIKIRKQEISDICGCTDESTRKTYKKIFSSLSYTPLE